MGIEDVKDRHEAELMRLSGVVGVGIGRSGNEDVIEVMVSRRTPHTVIPASLDGYAVKIVETGFISAHQEDDGD